MVAAAVIGGVATLAGGALSAGAASDAADASAQASAASIAEQRAAREELRTLLAPYTAAGTPALQQQMALLGLAGPEAEQSAISGISASPTFQALVDQGENSILQNASATGGLRGGNVQGALAQFSPQMLNQQIQQRMAGLGGITQLGQNSAAGVGNAGMTSAANIGNILSANATNQGNAAIAQGNAWGNAVGGLGQIGMVAASPILQKALFK